MRTGACRGGSGTTGGYVAEAAGETRKGAIVVIQEWWGLNDQIKRVADRYAAAGYDALAPDLYHGTVTKSPDEAQKLLMALDVPRAGADMAGGRRPPSRPAGPPAAARGRSRGGACGRPGRL